MAGLGQRRTGSALEQGRQGTLLPRPDFHSFCGAGEGCRRRPAIRRCSDPRRQLDRTECLLRCLPRRQENPAGPGFAAGEPIGDGGDEFYGGAEEVVTLCESRYTKVTSSSLESAMPPVLSLSLK